MSGSADDNIEEDIEIAPGVTKGDIYPYIYDKTYPFVFCSLCQSGITVPSAYTHLRSIHEKAVPAMQRNRATYTLTLLPNMARNETELDDYQGPVSVRKAIPYLGRPRTDGLKCNTCSFICRNARLMQRHCRTKHGLLTERRVGAPSRAARQRKFWVPWREGVKCQQLFKKRKLSQWFEVCDDEAIWGSDGAR
ncbi:hypothetical protein V8C42DRAFT_338738 [Trichoderma barbatum]